LTDNIATSGSSAGPAVLTGNSAILPGALPSGLIGASTASPDTPGHGSIISGDSVAVSGPAAVLSQLSGDRTRRLETLSAEVRGGIYQSASSAIAGAVIAQSVS
jgi:hypothetical protein